MNNADPQLEHVDPAHPVAPDAYIRVLNCKSNYVNILAGWFLKDGEKKFYIAEVRGGEFKHEVRQFQKPYDNQQAEQISLMV